MLEECRIDLARERQSTYLLPEPDLDVVLMEELHPPQQNTVTLHIHHL